jgi:hypothetical protein
MANGKKSVLLYCDLIHTVKPLTDEEAGKLFKHYLSYINDLNPEPIDRLTGLLFEPIKQNLKRDLVKWEIKSLKNSENAKMRWDKKDANACERIKSDANYTDIVTDTVKDTVTVKVKENNIEERKLKFASTLEPFLQTYGRDLLKEFYNYWTEPNKLNNKLRFESEKFWDLNRRLTTWKGKEKNFAQKKEKPTMRTTNEVFDNVIERIRNGEDTTVKIIGL